MSAKWTIQIMRIIGQLRLILMNMGHRLMTYTTQLIPTIISKVIRFLTQIPEFSNFNVNEKEEGCNYTKNDNKINPVPRRLIAQKKDGHKRKEETNEKPCDHLEVNIGSEKEPRMVKVGKSTPIEERNEIVKLLKEYRDVLAFTI
jgi:hypothetical protein